MPDESELIGAAVFGHYTANWGQPAKWLGKLDLGSRPVGLLEFPPNQVVDAWVYATFGMCEVDMQSPDGSLVDYGVELFIYSRQQQRDLDALMASLVAYPERMQSAFDWGHSVPGSGAGIIKGSDLTDVLLLRPYMESRGFEAFGLPNGRHIHLLWVVPVYRAERQYKVAHGHQALIDVFSAQDVDSSDLFRAAVELPV